MLEFWSFSRPLANCVISGSKLTSRILFIYMVIGVGGQVWEEVWSDRWFSTGDDSPHPWTFGNIWRCFWLPPKWEGMLLASSGWHTAMMLNSLQYKVQDHETKNYPAANVNSANAGEPWDGSRDVMTQVNLENILLSEGCQRQKATYCRTPFIWNIWKRQIHRGRK